MDPQNQAVSTINNSQEKQTKTNQIASSMIIDISKMEKDSFNTLKITTSAYNPTEIQQTSNKLSREPLKIKFKGIILCKVLSEIYLKSEKEYFPFFIKSLAWISKNTLKQKHSQLSFYQFQKRISKVLFTVIEHIVDEMKIKKISEAFKTLKTIKESK